MLRYLLSRKKEDKVNGTGRFHFMKNRYGMDGMTFSVVADTSTGHFEVTDHHFDDSDSPAPIQQIEGTNMNTSRSGPVGTTNFFS